jgi:hypothetical protein
MLRYSKDIEVELTYAKERVKVLEAELERSRFKEDTELLYEVNSKTDGVPYLSDTYNNRLSIETNCIENTYPILLEDGTEMMGNYINYQDIGWCVNGSWESVKKRVVGFKTTLTKKVL